MPNTIIKPGGTVGIIGGGQLGRMMAIAAAQLGYKVHIFAPDANPPAAQVANLHITAEYADLDELQRFADEVDVITYEFENIPTEALSKLDAYTHTRISPSVEILQTAQHRGREKDAVRAIGLSTAPYQIVTSVVELDAARKAIGEPGVLKTTRFGYDGKGQVGIQAKTSSADAWKKLNTYEAIYEGFVDFECELSVIVVRNEVSGSVTYATVQNIHKNHILDTTIAPAPLPKEVRKRAEQMACDIAESLNLRGMLAIEMFLTREGELLINEMAPRPHNSGHWTLNACVTSQFEQVIRAVCGLPLGSTRRLHNAVMKNLIGDEVHHWADYLKKPENKLHLYGKTEVRPGRKMGHVTQLVRKIKPEKFDWKYDDKD
mgnify:CR=1 FL=1